MFDELFGEHGVETWKALLWAVQAHEGQKRRDGAPYITHPIRVAARAENMYGQPELIAACLLHDVLEYTNITEEELRKEFPTTTVDIVKILTNKNQGYEDFIQSIIDSGNEDAVLVKICDIEDNLSGDPKHCFKRDKYLKALDKLSQYLAEIKEEQEQSW